MRARALAPLAACAALATVAVPAAVRAQAAPGGRCDLNIEQRGTRLTLTKLPSGKYNAYLGGGVYAYCAGQKITLQADSAEQYGDQNVMYLIGNVHYREPRVNLDADRITYWRAEERLYAEGNVYAVLPSGTTMRGPNADYYRAVTGLRPAARMIATGRPRIKLVQADSSGKPQEPVDVIADRVTMEADSVVYAGGRVEITRPDITATGDSAYMDSGREFARLLRRPVIRGKAERPFTLTGRVIDLYSRQRQLQRVLSQDSARAQSEDTDMRADTLDLRVVDNRLDRAFAWGRSRAHVISPGQELVADSLDVRMPQQRLQEVRAVRRALAWSAPDSTKLRSKERDWLRGDTIVALFDTAHAPGDTTSRPRIRQLVAVGSAQSYYQIPNDAGPTAPPSINYVRGDRITVSFSEQQVRTVTVAGEAAGLYLEPVRDTTARPSAAAPGSAPPRPTNARSGAAPAPRRPASTPPRRP